MMFYSLNTVVHLYKTKFDDFFIDFIEDKEKSLEYNCHSFVDTRNNVISLHYKDIKEDNISFRLKMKNRFEKINQILLKAGKICFISSRNEEIDVIKKFLNEMSKLYPGKITYINIRNNNKNDISNITLPVKTYDEKISKTLNIIEYEFKDIHPDGDDLKTNRYAWIGNYLMWEEIIRKISIKNKISFIKYLFINID